MNLSGNRLWISYILRQSLFCTLSAEFIIHCRLTFIVIWHVWHKIRQILVRKIWYKWKHVSATLSFCPLWTLTLKFLHFFLIHVEVCGIPTAFAVHSASSWNIKEFLIQTVTLAIVSIAHISIIVALTHIFAFSNIKRIEIKFITISLSLPIHRKLFLKPKFAIY